MCSRLLSSIEVKMPTDPFWDTGILRAAVLPGLGIPAKLHVK